MKLLKSAVGVIVKTLKLPVGVPNVAQVALFVVLINRAASIGLFVDAQSAVSIKKEPFITAFLAVLLVADGNQTIALIFEVAVMQHLLPRA